MEYSKQVLYCSYGLPIVLTAMNRIIFEGVDPNAYPQQQPQQQQKPSTLGKIAKWGGLGTLGALGAAGAYGMVDPEGFGNAGHAVGNWANEHGMTGVGGAINSATDTAQSGLQTAHDWIAETGHRLTHTPEEHQQWLADRQLTNQANQGDTDAMMQKMQNATTQTMNQQMQQYNQSPTGMAQNAQNAVETTMNQQAQAAQEANQRVADTNQQVNASQKAVNGALDPNRSLTPASYQSSVKPQLGTSPNPQIDQQFYAAANDLNQQKPLTMGSSTASSPRPSPFHPQETSSTGIPSREQMGNAELNTKQPPRGEYGSHVG